VYKLLILTYITTFSRRQITVINSKRTCSAAKWRGPTLHTGRAFGQRTTVATGLRLAGLCQDSLSAALYA